MESLTWEERQKFDRLLAQKKHLINFTDEGWTIGHPIRERLNDTLFNCQVKWSGGDQGFRGTYYLEDDGRISAPYEGDL